MAANHHKHAAKRDILTYHHQKFCDFRVFEFSSQFGDELSVDAQVIRRHPFCQYDGQRLAWFELSFVFGEINLLDRLFVEALTRRRRVPCEESSITFIDGRDLESCEFFDSSRDEAVRMTGAKELEEFSKKVWNQFHRVDASGVVWGIRSGITFDRGRIV